MVIKKTNKTDLTIKEAQVFHEGDLIQMIDLETGDPIDILKIAESLFGEGEFKLTLSASVSDELDPTDFEEE